MSDGGLLGHDAHTQNGPAKRESFAVTACKGLVILATAAIVCATLVVVVDTRNTLSNVRDSIAAMGQQQVKERESSYGVSSMPPRKFQYSRGTCWDFGTVGAIEHQYRLQGIAQGYLQPNQYTQFSEQAYGNRIINLCQQNQNLCFLPGDNVAFNSTEGGEAILLQTFRKQLQNLILPWQVCPYINPADNSSCPGIEHALAVNPISFTVDSYKTYYDIAHIKAGLRASAYAMPLTVQVHTTSFYLPCSDAFVSQTPVCTQPSQCIPCPTGDSSFPTSCCYEFATEMFAMNGEFYKHHALQLEAGHVMLLAGYNDEWQFEYGMTGGLIMRNTWADGVYSFNEFGTDPRQRGSHSLPYFLGQISLADERMVCPNSADPRQWYTCGGGSIDPVAITQNCVGLDATGHNENAETAVALYQPYHLQCRAKAAASDCKQGTQWQYFMLNETTYTDGLKILCFLEYNTQTPNVPGTPRCYSPRPYDWYSLLFGPIAAEDLQNSQDHCGYYAYPYQLARESLAAFDGFFVSDYKLTFDPMSYAANAAANSAKDYTLTQVSTKTQSDFPQFDNPYPNDLETTN